MLLGFYSNMEGIPWGASEELWSQSALRLLDRGYSVTVNYKSWPNCPQRLAEIQSRGGTIFWRRGRQSKKLRCLWKRVTGIDLANRWLDRMAPKYVLINSCAHLGDVGIAQACIERQIPYAILVHGANPLQWVTDRHLDGFRQAFEGARKCYFVSHQNQTLMEANLAMRLPQSQVVDNPLNVRRHVSFDWPTCQQEWRLACVARLDFASKGQDLILQVLRSDKWRKRPIQVSFWGDTQQQHRQFADLIALYQLHDKVRICGVTSDVEQVWKEHHALLLPSRYEGMPIVTVEAMICGRVAIVSDAGRNKDVIDDNETGFLARGPSVETLDDAMERAWMQRHQWQHMGRLAAERIAQRYSADPVGDFAREIEELASGSAAPQSKPVVHAMQRVA